MVGTGSQPPKKKDEKKTQKPKPESNVGTGSQPPKKGGGD